MKKKNFNRAIRILLFTNALIIVAPAMLAPIYTLYVEDIGGDLFDAGLTTAVYSAVIGLIILLSGRISDRVKENELLIVAGYGITGVGFLMYMIVDSVSTLFIIQVVLGIGEAISAPAFDALYTKHLNIKRAGTHWAAWEFINYFSLTVGSVVGGMIVTMFGFNPLFVIMALLSFFSAGYLYLLPRRVL